MESYHSLAYVYDHLMSHVDYQEWVNGLEREWQKTGEHPQTILDLGCGTGNILVELSRRNYSVYGIDNSPEMLAICFEKLGEHHQQVNLLEKDMRDFTLPQQVDAVICLCDTLNYLLDEEELLQTFQSINRCLKSEGSFIFDLRTPHYYETTLSNNQWVQEEDDVVLIWNNDYSEQPIMEMNLTFFVNQVNDMYRRYEEIHIQRCYEIEKIESLLEKAGFIVEQISSDLSGTSLDDLESERMYFITSKK